MTEIVTFHLPPARPLFGRLPPAIFTVGCALGAIWPGHGGQLFGIGALVGVWAPFVVFGGADASHACWLAGLPIVAGVRRR